MAVMEEHEQSLSLIYSKRTGIIKMLGTGVQSIETTFGENAEDMAVIYDCLVIPFNQDVMDNYLKYQVIDGKVVKTVTSKEEQAIADLTAENTALKNDLELVKTVLDTLIMGV